MRKNQSNIPENLIIFELANNHMGDISHGLEVIRQFGRFCRKYSEFNFAFKLQYRDLDTFVHPSMKGRLDVKYIKRFEETRLSRGQFDQLVSEIREQGFYAIATPFDNASVDVIDSQGLDIIKIASCSFTDWHLLERVAQSKLPVIASTAGASLSEIDRVVSFFSHRNKDFAILHCVGEYPTPDENLNLDQIDSLMERYPDVRIGFSTHENPESTDIVKMAIAKGVSIFEKHVGVHTSEYPINGYSATPGQIDAWLTAARFAKKICGNAVRNPNKNKAELESLRALRRGLFARRPIRAGEALSADDIYFAFPPDGAQFTASDWSKYARFVVTSDIEKDGALKPENTEIKDERELVLNVARKVKELIRKSGIVVPGGVELEISHHYGLERFQEVGLTMLTVVNRSYCKKILVSLPGQKHPEQFHKQKEETFNILYGEVEISLDGNSLTYRAGDVITIEPGVRHAFFSKDGCIIEEISSTHYNNDSFYTDETIQENKNRKTVLTYWMD